MNEFSIQPNVPKPPGINFKANHAEIGITPLQFELNIFH
jgi:hypothetical protein